MFTYDTKDLLNYFLGNNSSSFETRNNKGVIVIKNQNFQDITLNFQNNYPYEIVIENCNFQNLSIESGNFKDRFIIRNSNFKILTFSGGKFNQGLYLNNCEISGPLGFVRGQKEVPNISSLSLSYNSASQINIDNLDLEYISLSKNKAKTIVISHSLIIPATANTPFRHLYGKIKYLNFDLEEKTKLITDYLEVDSVKFRGTLNNAEVIMNMMKIKKLSFENFVKTNSGFVNLFKVDPLDNESSIIIHNSFLGNSTFNDCNFKDFEKFLISNSHFSDIIYNNTTWPKSIGINKQGSYTSINFTKEQEKIQLREAYRQLKLASARQGDKLQESIFYRKEMIYLNKTLPFKNIGTKITLYLGYISNNHKNSWLLPISLLLLFNAFFTVLLWSVDIYNLRFDWNTFFNLMNPAHKFESLELEKHFNLLSIDFISRIVTSFLIYQVIAAFRRLNK